jgi:hypothetical protein
MINIKNNEGKIIEAIDFNLDEGWYKIKKEGNENKTQRIFENFTIEENENKETLKEKIPPFNPKIFEAPKADVSEEELKVSDPEDK